MQVLSLTNKTENTTRQKEGLSIMVMENSHQHDIEIVLVDASNSRALKSIKQN